MQVACKISVSGFVSSLLVLLSIVLMPYNSLSQQDSGIVTVQVNIVQLGFYDIGTMFDKEVEPVFNFYLDSHENGRLLNPKGLCYHFNTKDGKKYFLLSKPEYQAIDPNLEFFKMPILTKSGFKLVLECFENDKGNECKFEQGDDFHFISSKDLDLNAFTPGDFSDTFRITDDKTHFYAVVKLRYDLLPPANITATSPIQAVNSIDKPISLASSYPLPNHDRLNFIWEYSLNQGATWVKLGDGNTEKITIHIKPKEQIFPEGITSNQKAAFRLKVSSRDTFSFSNTFNVFFTPPAPSVLRENVVITPTCKNDNGGIIKIKSVSLQSSRLSYILRRGINKTDTCNLMYPSSCPDMVKSGQADASGFEIANLPEDVYTLIIYNAGLNVGKIFNSYNMKINALPLLKVDDFVVRSPTCTDNRPGEISFNLEGGNPDSLSIKITPEKGSISKSGNRVVISNLEEGSYYLEIADKCNQSFSKSMIVTADTLTLTISSSKLIPSDDKKAAPDMSMTILNGKGPFQITITDEQLFSKTIDSIMNNTPVIKFPHKGKFRVEIIDKSNPTCFRIDTSFLIVKVGHPGLVEEPDYFIDNHSRKLPNRLAQNIILAHQRLFPRPFGVFYEGERACYEDVMAMQLEEAIAKKGKGDLDKLLKGSEVWEIA